MSRSLALPETATVTDLAHDGRGIAHLNGKAVFVAGALPGEVVSLARRRRRRHFDEAQLVAVLKPSPQRVAARCAHFGVCGGCALQHADSALQHAAKQGHLLAELERTGRVVPETVLAPLAAEPWHYRRRARLGAKYLVGKSRAVVGFRERDAPFITDVRDCPVLSAQVAGLCGELGELIGGLTIRDRVPQIEVAVADEATALCFRVLAAPSASDEAKLAAFGVRHGLAIWLQSGGPASARPLGAAPALTYRLPEFDVELEFGPLDFIQVNAQVNRLMVRRAIECLAPAAGDAVLDLYCGLGNFTLPLARRAGRVQGVEGAPELILRARDNARRNGIGNAEFAVADLSADCRELHWARQRYSAVLLDPPRLGAREVLPLIAATGAGRIVYVSCHPGSLARDAQLLVHEHGYALKAAGIIDMFPHTAHVESLAVFERR
jgi:23S rRNA (uracil1939-C5)-methyltransferase